MPNVTEDAPYATSEPSDVYAASKIEAQRPLVAANDEQFTTCALRPGGIYGPGQRHRFPRIVGEVLGGRFAAKVGPGTARGDNIYIDDLVDAHFRAAERLEAGSPVASRADQLGDGHPISFFDFSRPVIEHLGRRFPAASVPVASMYLLAWIAKLLHFVGGPTRS